MIAFTIPNFRLQSLSNCRMHWRAMARLKSEQKTTVGVYLLKALMEADLPTMRFPLVVTMTRVGPRKLDGDNLASTFKYARDAIAARFGVDDGSDLWVWVCEQRIGKTYAVEISITELSKE